MSDSTRIEELKRRVLVDPASIAFAALAEEYRRHGQLEDAVATCRAGLQRHPAYLSARVTLGRALLEMGQFDEGRKELEQVLRVAPENLAAIRALADIHNRRRELPEALDRYPAETEQHPTKESGEAPAAASESQSAGAPAAAALSAATPAQAPPPPGARGLQGASVSEPADEPDSAGVAEAPAEAGNPPQRPRAVIRAIALSQLAPASLNHDAESAAPAVETAASFAEREAASRLGSSRGVAIAPASAAPPPVSPDPAQAALPGLQALLAAIVHARSTQPSDSDRTVDASLVR